jgi:N6-adenosine-specific RNA methylase IME4
MIGDARLVELVDSMRERGYDATKPIILYRGEILDGRNRHKAAMLAGVEPVFADAPDDCDPWEESWKHNGLRRDLSEGQRVAICDMKNKASAEWHEQKRRATEDANKRRAEAARAQHEVSAPWAGERMPRSEVARLRTVDGCASQDAQPSDRRHAADRALAQQAGVSEATASRLATVAREKPELIPKIATGEVKLAEAVRIVKREAVASCQEWPADKYRVIYADPPWKYGDERGGLGGYEDSAAAGQYPTMPTEAICALDVKSLGLPDSVLFCWATFPLLPDALRVVQSWGYKYKTAIVWSKERPNMGHYHQADAELLIIGTRGSCTPESETRPRQVQTIKRTGRHSEKPDEFRALIDAMYASGPRIIMFHRGEAPKGWVAWGNEATSDSSAA